MKFKMIHSIPKPPPDPIQGVYDWYTFDIVMTAIIILRKLSQASSNSRSTSNSVIIT